MSLHIILSSLSFSLTFIVFGIVSCKFFFFNPFLVQESLQSLFLSSLNNVSYSRWKMGRPKRTCMVVVMIDMKKCNLFEHLAQDRPEWWNINHVADSNIVGMRLWWWWRRLTNLLLEIILSFMKQIHVALFAYLPN